MQTSGVNGEGGGNASERRKSAAYSASLACPIVLIRDSKPLKRVPRWGGSLGQF